MKIDARNIAHILQDTAKFRAFLIYGENSGLVRDRATQLVKKVAGSLDDAFQVCVLDKEQHDRLAEEANALSLMGGLRAVWIRDASETITKPLEVLLAETREGYSFDSVIIIEAGILSTRSGLRVLAEKHPLVATIACYAETGRNLEESVRHFIGKKRINSESFRALLACLGNDRAVIRNEIEKLLLYVGAQPEITVTDIHEAIGDGAEYSVEDVAYAVMSGHVGLADRALGRAISEGVTMIAVLRSLLYHIDRLMQVRISIEAGTPAKSAVSHLSPPVFFKRTDDFLKALDNWHSKRLLMLSQYVQHMEYLCKQTATPAEDLCRQFCLLLAQSSKEKRDILNKGFFVNFP